MTKRLAVPKEADEYVDECHWSRSGYAIWKRVENMEPLHNYCTCRPARRPRRTAAASTRDSA